MNDFLILLYNYFNKHKILFYGILFSVFLLMLTFAVQVKFEENINRFFPDTEDTHNATQVFDNLKIKDKIIILFSAGDTVAEPDPDRLIAAGQRFEQLLRQKVGDKHLKEVFSAVDEQMVSGVTGFIYDNLPVFLTEADYSRFDSLLTKQGIESRMKQNYRNLLSPAGIALKDILLRDPVGLGNAPLESLKDFQVSSNYEIYNGSIFSKDMKVMLHFITPRHGTGSTGVNDELVDALETSIAQVNAADEGVVTEYFGGPSVAVYNARQIKSDTMITLTIALIIIVIFISVAFKRKSAIPLIVLPVLFGGVFSLCMIYFIKGSISAIAIGAGSAVFGIALSYSIHVLSHLNHVSSPQQLIREIAYPLTVGSFTTIGAFIGLMFTSSELLSDFGLFSAFVLIGTTFFCLVFLPHFLKRKENLASGRLMRWIERINSYEYDRNKWLIGAIAAITLVCLYTSGWVSFDNDMMNLNYEPEHLKKTEKRITDLFQTDNKTVLFVSVGKTLDEGLQTYARTNKRLQALKDSGQINNFASVERILIPADVQQKRIARWNEYWTPERKTAVREWVTESGQACRFKEDSFNPFFAILDRNFGVCDFLSDQSRSARIFDDWATTSDSLAMVISQVQLDDAQKDAVYEQLSSDNQLVIFDRSYFASKWVSVINNDFYLILYISSFLIFFALLISYGRIEITLMTFLPMMISWVIILGLMGILGIQFNIVNIILSTFIFGIGDDFSIFIMDGLQSEYKTGKKMLSSHKIAIFFSAFTTMVGMGALIFAKHPALQSISFISILGMLAVVLVAYTIQPVLFRVFIGSPARKGNAPYTLFSLLMTCYSFIFFVTGCLILRLIILLLYIVPVRRKTKKLWCNYLVMYTCRTLLCTTFILKRKKINTSGETFKTPAVIVANHQSFLDILELLALTPRLVMVTNSWVWNSPFFGKIVRYAGFYTTDSGYELLDDVFRERISDGYSIVVFPEGTRSEEGKLKRFHKGAFYLAERLGLDIVPLVFYGNGLAISKAQPIYVKNGYVITKILPRIFAGDDTFGTTYQEKTKQISRYFRVEYEALKTEYHNTSNPYFYHALIKNYIYKGPVLEWYMRIKVKMENQYRLFDELIPRTATVTDIGCGYGPLPYMLTMLSGDRYITGIDYDEEKIEVASHCFLKRENLCFIQADALCCKLPQSDVFVLNDMLHYIDYESQQVLLDRCLNRLNTGGMIIVRDGDRTNEKRHWLTRFSEFCSVKVFRFNKAGEDLFFPGRERFFNWAETHLLDVQMIANDKYTSNTIYLFKKKQE